MPSSLPRLLLLLSLCVWLALADCPGFCPSCEDCLWDDVTADETTNHFKPVTSNDEYVACQDCRATITPVFPASYNLVLDLPELDLLATPDDSLFVYASKDGGKTVDGDALISADSAVGDTVKLPRGQSAVVVFTSSNATKAGHTGFTIEYVAELSAGGVALGFAVVIAVQLGILTVAVGGTITVVKDDWEKMDQIVDEEQDDLEEVRKPNQYVKVYNSKLRAMGLARGMSALTVLVAGMLGGYVASTVFPLDPQIVYLQSALVFFAALALHKYWNPETVPQLEARETAYQLGMQRELARRDAWCELYPEARQKDVWSDEACSQRANTRITMVRHPKYDEVSKLKGFKVLDSFSQKMTQVMQIMPMTESEKLDKSGRIKRKITVEANGPEKAHGLSRGIVKPFPDGFWEQPDRAVFQDPKKKAGQDLLKGIDVLLHTVNENEFNMAVSETLMTPLADGSGPFRVSVNTEFVFIGRYGNSKVAVFRQSVQGSFGAIEVLPTLLDALKPKLVCAVGVAYGMNPKKQAIGDVLVSRGIIPVSGIKRINADGSVDNRTESSTASGRAFKLFQSPSAWAWNHPLAGRRVKAHFGPLLTGDILLDNLERKALLLKKHPLAVGGEMEGIGIEQACSSREVPWIIVKAISDWGDGTKAKDWQPWAAFMACSFVSSALKAQSYLSSS